LQILVHIGLNKCGSTFIQHALDQARSTLKAAGCWYPEQCGPPCQYGLSKTYGFGPDAPEVVSQELTTLIHAAYANRCNKLILSSEYFSLQRPQAAAKFWHDLNLNADKVQIVVFSREVFGWVRSLFNQYVKAVEGPGQLDDLNAFIDQTLRNRALDLAARLNMWRDLAPEDSFRHYRLSAHHDRNTALGVFETFAGLTVELEAPDIGNSSIAPAALHRIGQLRRRLPSPDRDAEITRLLTGGASPYPAPDGFLDISPARRARLIREIIAPYLTLPESPLPVFGSEASAVTKTRVTEPG
jgi:hypothetical protein